MFPLKADHSIRDRLYWNFFNMIPFLIGSIAIARDSLKWVAVYIGIALFFFLVIEFRFACTHCLYYIRSKGCVKCMMLSGVPKIFKARPGPHSSFEKAMTILGALPMFLFPVYWLVRDPLLLGAYGVSWVLFFLTARRYECVRCLNFECPMNRVPSDVKKEFENEDRLSGNFEFSGKGIRESCSYLCVSLRTKHEFKDFLYWNFVTLTILFSAGIAIGISSTGWLLAYIFIVFFHFDILEQRFFCTHCPYFVRGEKSLRCMMNWGWPRHFRPRPHPPGKFDLVITTMGFIVVLLFPLPWLLKMPFLLGAYCISILLFLLTIRRYECSRCIYFGCPFNRVPVDVRKEFEKRNEFEMGKRV
ncbi:hypothetical protein MSSIH_3771 [Methanosarcina siciliae HI350]|uniref:Uncharacterized protein n=1 Tax=Methanosarcina siciliae HI350 TaxID=1434119 RepID=A0A0E3LBW1_9EURY|nr:hypothetical protein [Methanosarcina siciliae]AKB34461.1 hypothetical protein MSSIH_3771 [Methanosarcina siciliae HI350]